MGDAGLRRIGPRLDVAEEGRCVRPHRWQLSTHAAAGPQTVVGRQSFGRILVARGGLAGSGESFRRFPRAVTARRDKRVAVGHLQLRQSLPLRGLRLDLVRLRQRREQRLRLGLRHLRMGASPSPVRERGRGRASAASSDGEKPSSPALLPDGRGGSLRARARERRRPRRGGRSIGRVWQATAPRAVRNCACLAASRRRWRSGTPLRAGAGLAGSRSSRTSPRARCRSASNAR